MKVYTDLIQSRKLSEILLLKSADMHYARAYFEGNEQDWFIGLGKPIKSDDIIPCWSLAALLDVLPYPSLHKTSSGWRCDSYDKEGKTCKLGENADNQVDACVAMIIKLHELNLL